jgi:hypothetical protein
MSKQVEYRSACSGYENGSGSDTIRIRLDPGLDPQHCENSIATVSDPDPPG